MPTIGGLLDAWDTLPNDITSDPELADFVRRLKTIETVMEK